MKGGKVGRTDGRSDGRAVGRTLRRRHKVEGLQFIDFLEAIARISEIKNLPTQVGLVQPPTRVY